MYMNSIQEELHSKPSERLLKHSFLTFLLVSFSFVDIYMNSIQEELYSKTSESSGKKIGGRRKIEIKIIENEDDGLI
ncbi:hypothetical protein Golob_004223 [Gossypium lobatum]|uniref:Uncharacterized protein n=1 Tax=Gossypium lobatum TaxID=34289 RepID=A0A7J8N164_9ROSI|nr:hypothetical protein [Gossypium lobatum]